MRGSGAVTDANLAYKPIFPENMEAGLHYAQRMACNRKHQLLILGNRINYYFVLFALNIELFNVDFYMMLYNLMYAVTLHLIHTF